MAKRIYKDPVTGEWIEEDVDDDSIFYDHGTGDDEDVSLPITLPDRQYDDARYKGPGYYDEITGEFIPTDGPGVLPGPLDDTSGTEQLEGWNYKDGVWTDPSGKKYDLSYLNVTDKSALKSLFDKAKKLLGGGGSEEDYLKLLPFLGGLFAANQSSDPTLLNPGYQGGIPEVKATRTMLTEPPAGRRPGSGGINYGGDVTYTRTGQNLSAANAGISSPESQPLGGTAPLQSTDLASLIALLQQLGISVPGQSGAPAPAPAPTSGSGQFVIGGGGASPGLPSAPTTPSQASNQALIEQLFRNIYGRPAAAWELENVKGMSPEQIIRTLNESKAALSPAPAPNTSGFAGIQDSGNYKGFANEAQYNQAVLYKAQQDADRRAKIDAYQINANSMPTLLPYLQDPTKIPRLHNESVEDALRRIKSQDMEYSERMQRRQALADQGGGFGSVAAPAPAPAPSPIAGPTSSPFVVGGGAPVAPTPAPANDLQSLFQQVYGRAGTAAELQNVAGRDPNEVRGILENSLAQWKASQPVMAAEGGLLPDGFVIPADVVSHFGNGSSEAGLDFLAETLGAKPIKGEGDGMSDSIPTTIGGEQPARVANDEAFVPPEVVKRLGGGDTDRGAQKLYDMMARIRKARTGSEEQGKQINPEKFMPGGKVDRYQTGGTTVPAATSQSLSDWVGPYVADMLGKGLALSESPYQAYTGPLTAGASPLQEQAFGTASAMQTPTALGQGAGLAATIGQGIGGMGYTPVGQSITGGALTQPVSGAPTSAVPSMPGSQPISNIAQAYMNPYLESVLNPQMREMTRQADIARQADAARLAKAGAFGGSRQAIMESEGRRNLLQQQSDVLGQGYASAYDKALSQFNTEQQRKIQEAQFGSELGLKGAQTGLQAADILGNIGTREGQFGLDQIRSLADLGAVQRGIESEGIAADKAQFEEARLNPYKMLQFQQSLLSGLPIASQSVLQPGASNLQQFSSGFTTLAEALKALGLIKPQETAKKP